MKNVIKKLCISFLCFKSGLLMAGFSLYELPEGGICLVFTDGLKTVRESMTNGFPIQIFLYTQNDEQRVKFDTLGESLDKHILEQLQVAINEKDNGEALYWPTGRTYQIQPTVSGSMTVTRDQDLASAAVQRPSMAGHPLMLMHSFSYKPGVTSFP